MLIRLRDKNRKLVVKDMLDIDFDMSVERNGNKYCININPIYKLDEEFGSEEIAEENMVRIANNRNHLEEELRNY